jgi:hypothetical protein
MIAVFPAHNLRQTKRKSNYGQSTSVWTIFNQSIDVQLPFTINYGQSKVMSNAFSLDPHALGMHAPDHHVRMARRLHWDWLSRDGFVTALYDCSICIRTEVSALGQIRHG